MAASCPYCGHMPAQPEDLRGRKIRCAQCRGKYRMPEEREGPALPLEPPPGPGGDESEQQESEAASPDGATDFAMSAVSPDGSSGRDRPDRLAYAFRSRPLLPPGPGDPRRTSRLVCPHCWHAFAVEDTLFISAHADLMGDPVLGAEAPQRFLPSRFTPTGNAIDPSGVEAPDRACPRCHLRLPRCLYERAGLFVSIVGAPASGKSYFLTAMTWELRQRLGREFQFLFSDADAQTNHWINAQEELLFLSKEPGQPVFLRKTELQGDLYQPVRIDGMTVQLPTPSIFALEAKGGHPKTKRMGTGLTRNVVLYDNAGEHFQPGMDTAANPGTQHLIRSQAILFVFDPTTDVRLMERKQKSAPSVDAKPQVHRSQRQEVLLTEMVTRIARHRGLPAGTRTDIPLIVTVSKWDAWGGLLQGDAADDPVRFSRSLGMAALDLDAVATASLRVRRLLLDTCPEIVQIAEGFSRYVFYVPVTALGHAPALGQDGAYVVRPADVRPRWVCVPFLLVMSLAGFIPVLRRPSSGQETRRAEVKVAGSALDVRVPGTSVRHVLPMSFAGTTVECPDSGVRFSIPSLEELGAPVTGGGSRGA